MREGSGARSDGVKCARAGCIDITVRMKMRMSLHLDIGFPLHKGSLAVLPLYPSPPTSLNWPPLTAALTAISARTCHWCFALV